MCRLLAYLGEPIPLERWVCTPRHALVRQALRAEEARTVTNGDGFGVGWYAERPEPGVYREVMPAWSDENLLSLCATVRSPLFFAHVRAATGGGIARQNCHPFQHGPWLFMHNGQIGGYERLRRALEARLPDPLFAARRGATDSELLFLLTLARIDTGVEPPVAVGQVLYEVMSLMRVRQVPEPLRFVAALSDGRSVWAFRAASDGQPPTLYLGPETDGGQVVASEPLDGQPARWQPVPPNSWLRLHRRGTELHPRALGELLASVA